jgi:SAM-dependent methyltransferase
MKQIGAEELVAAAYRGVLSREADDSGREVWRNRLEQHGPESILSGLIQSEEFRRRYLLSQVKTGSPDLARWITSWLVHLQIGDVLHPPRLDLVQRILPAGEKVLDLGGASGQPQGALLQMGYKHAKDLTIVDLPLDIRFKPGPDVQNEFNHEGTTIRYSYHSMADLSYYDDESFDLVWSGQTYEHITEEEGLALFPQIVRVLKKGGIFAMDTPNRTLTRIMVGEKEWIHYEHKIEYFYEDFVSRFSNLGLRLIDRRGILNMPETLRHGHGILGELSNNTVNYTPETSYCFYLAFQKPNNVY